MGREACERLRSSGKHGLVVRREKGEDGRGREEGCRGGDGGRCGKEEDEDEEAECLGNGVGEGDEGT